MRNRCFIIVVVFFSLIDLSCTKYLDVEPKGVKLLVTVDDYDKFLNAQNLATSLPIALNQFGDNIDRPTIASVITSPDDFQYLWAPDFSVNADAPPEIWWLHYRSIYAYNTVINGIDEAIEGTMEQKTMLKSEAMVGRAFEYLYLVNLYGRPFNLNTADSDLAVPIIYSTDINSPTPKRSTVNEVYNHIISEVNSAIPNLPKSNNNYRFRPSIASAYSILARAYLYKGDFDMSKRMARQAIDLHSGGLIDYNKLQSASGISLLSSRQDVIFARLSATNFNAAVTPTLSFLKTFDKNDLRLKFFYSNVGDYSFNNRGDARYYPGGFISGAAGTAYPNWGTSVFEMHLIIAECAARSGNISEALEILNLVRRYRIAQSNFTELRSDDAEVVLNEVLEERLLEFSFCGMRWFDMRRLNAEGRMPPVFRYSADGSILAELQPKSARYTLRIPPQVMRFNPTWLQNP